MHYSDFLREEAERYRKLAQCARSDCDRQEYLELAEVCEQAAARVDDLRASG